MFFVPQAPLARRIAYLGAIFASALFVRILLGIARPDLDVAQGAVAGMATMVFMAPTLHGLFHDKPFLTPERRGSYAALSVCVALAFVVFVCLS